MAKVLLKTLVIILFFILLSSRVYAINVGSVIKNKFAEISSSESAKFTMLFWNVESKPYIVRLLVEEAPKDWIIIIDPVEFVLNKSIGEEYINLPYTNENIKAKVVNLFVKPDSNSKPGKYFVTVKAETKLPWNEGNGITVIPERVFKFEINLKGLVDSNDDIKNKENMIEFSEKDSDSKNENLINNSKNENQINKKYFYFVIMLLVIFISIIIYKKS